MHGKTRMSKQYENDIALPKLRRLVKDVEASKVVGDDRVKIIQHSGVGRASGGIGGN